LSVHALARKRFVSLTIALAQDVLSAKVLFCRKRVVRPAAQRNALYHVLPQQGEWREW